jgi:mannose-6-phosphate isomerase-like protein (cupin superfamily)
VNQNAKPWGSYIILHKGPDFQVKRVEVNPNLRLSLQKHAQRAEKWMVVSGSGVATVGQKEVPVKRGSVVEIAIGQPHRMHNTGRKSLVFIEVQLGEYLGEDDIIRLEDDFDRAGKKTR